MLCKASLNYPVLKSKSSVINDLDENDENVTEYIIIVMQRIAIIQFVNALPLFFDQQMGVAHCICLLKYVFS